MQGVQAVLDDPETNGDIGPAAGILTAATSKSDATWLILAVDLPFISRDSILHLLKAHLTDSPVSLYLHSDDGNPEPLFSIWTPTALAQLRSNCRAGKSGPCRAAKDVWGGKIGPGAGGVEVPTEDWITDADTPDEWRAVQRRLGLSESVSAAPVEP
jgi:molybdopterin-guanine dinucleotide biosynthesis protein A